MPKQKNKQNNNNAWRSVQPSPFTKKCKTKRLSDLPKIAQYVLWFLQIRVISSLCIRPFSPLTKLSQCPTVTVAISTAEREPVYPTP